MTASTDTGRRVALLARPGEACERLRAVLAEAGAHCVLAADPTELDPAALLQAQPQLVLVALDPLIEDVLERFEPVLADSSIDVIYEEADQVVAREGWAVARWQRHLVAKLLGHADVLPPGRESDEAISVVIASSVESPSAAAHAMFDPLNAEADESFGDLALPLELPPEPAITAMAEPFEFDAVFDTASIDTAPETSVEPNVADDGAGLDFSFEDLSYEPAAASESAAIDPGETGFEAFDAFDPVMAELATEPPFEPAPMAAATAAMTLELAEPGTDSAETAHKFQHDLNDLQQRISTLELVDDSPVRGPEKARGAVLVLSGIGGPDAVRQLLGALPDDFSRPVLVQQRLDGGRYDKLVTQLQRATALPVKLAMPGEAVLSGVVYILPAAVGITAEGGGLSFNDDAGGNVLAALAPADSAVLLLSGSDPEQVDAVMNHSWGGALVAGQAADGCYDAAAPNALAARGGDTAPPAELALRLAERWSARGTKDVEA